jgi:hypothetical protein
MLLPLYHFKTQTMHIKLRRHNIIAMLYLKTLYPGGISTRVFCVWAVCDAHCAIQGTTVFPWLKQAPLKFKSDPIEASEVLKKLSRSVALSSSQAGSFSYWNIFYIFRKRASFWCTTRKAVLRNMFCLTCRRNVIDGLLVFRWKNSFCFLGKENSSTSLTYIEEKVQAKPP